MRSSDLKYGFEPTLRAATVALGLVALAVGEAPAAPAGEATTEAGAGSAPTGPRGPAQVAGPRSHAAAPGPGRIGDRGDMGDILGGHEAFAMEGADISATFDSLSRKQQARVMQRCRDVLARPAQADADHLTICQALMAITKR